MSAVWQVSEAGQPNFMGKGVRANRGGFRHIDTIPNRLVEDIPGGQNTFQRLGRSYGRHRVTCNIPKGTVSVRFDGNNSGVNEHGTVLAQAQ